MGKAVWFVECAIARDTKVDGYSKLKFGRSISFSEVFSNTLSFDRKGIFTKNDLLISDLIEANFLQ